MTTATLITAEEYATMSFDRPVELVRGEIVEMTNPGGRHGLICVNLSFELKLWIRDGAPYRVVSNDSGVQTQRDPDSVRGPDLLVIQQGKLPDGKVQVGHFTTPPDVAIEVRSPTDRWPGVIAKAGEFLSAGVGEVWVIDPDHWRVHVFCLHDEPTILNINDVLSSQLLPGFSCPVTALFEGGV